MDRQRAFHLALIMAIACSLVTGSFVARVAVDQAVAETSQVKSGTTSPGNPFTELNKAQKELPKGTSSQRDLRLVAASVIKYALGLIGTVMLVLMLYAGYQWFSAAGDDSKVEEAKKTIRNAVIGMILIALTYTLVSFVVNNVFQPAPLPPTGEGFTGGLLQGSSTLSKPINNLINGSPTTK